MARAAPPVERRPPQHDPRVDHDGMTVPRRLANPMRHFGLRGRRATGGIRMTSDDRLGGQRVTPPIHAKRQEPASGRARAARSARAQHRVSHLTASIRRRARRFPRLPPRDLRPLWLAARMRSPPAPRRRWPPPPRPQFAARRLADAPRSLCIASAPSRIARIRRTQGGDFGVHCDEGIGNRRASFQSRRRSGRRFAPDRAGPKRSDP